MTKRFFSIFRYILFILLLFSCQSDKVPLWVSDPPPDDDLHIYIVGVGKDDELFSSILNQIYERFNITENTYLKELILVTLNDETNDDATIIDRWSSDENDYVLVRLKRSFFDPVLALYSTQYEEMLAYSHDSEIEGNVAVDNGEMYSAFSLYVKALDEMLSYQDEFYTPSIISLINKIQEILDQIEYENIQKFSELIIGKPILNEKFSFTINSNKEKTYDGFRYKIGFYEGWDNNKRSTIIPIRDNSMNFIPPRPVISGKVSINSSLSIDNLQSVVDTWLNHLYLSNSIRMFKSNINEYINASKIEFDYNVRSDLRLFTKLISFENSMITEGVIRFLLENDDESIAAPILVNEESLLSYVRELTTITGSQYRYLILGQKIDEDRAVFDENGIIINLSTSFQLIDMLSFKILLTENIKTKYIGESGDDEFAYLDLGLKIGEIIYNIKF